MLKKLVLVMMILLLFVLSILGSYLFKSRTIPDKYVLEIPVGSSLTLVAKKLKKSGIIAHDKYFIRLLDYLELEGKIQAGNYSIESSDNLYTIIKKIVHGSVIYHKIVIYEGITFTEIVELIKKNKSIEQTDFLNEHPYTQITGITLNSMEGIFYPDTYYYNSNSKDKIIYEKAYNKMNKLLTYEWEHRQDNLPYTNAYEALILASIIEKETHFEEEKHLVAAVFINRLKKSMRLQADPTIVYSLGNKYTGRLTKRNLAKDNPYNTYTRRGLPPTPICNPSRTSIHAALNPENSDYLYFVLNIKGKHVFSSTLTEHNLAVKQYRNHKNIH
ncbi:MAG: endolytic transglycosylase MltG [Legionellales bacterium]|nr:endolytic transglycosylase MltG [Legionellales bacterium]